jgi:hypothetical protein
MIASSNTEQLGEVVAGKRPGREYSAALAIVNSLTQRKRFRACIFCGGAAVRKK